MTKGARVAGQVGDVTDETFEAEVLESETAVLVDFWAPWCGPCRVVSPILEEIHAEREDLRVVKLNVDENQVTAVRYEVLSIPTMILFKNGEVAKKLIGAQPKARSRRSWSRRWPDPGPWGAGAGGWARGVWASRHLPRNQEETARAHVAYRAVVLAGVLLVLGLLFRQLATLLLAVLMTVIIAIPLSAGADPPGAARGPAADRGAADPAGRRRGDRRRPRG